MAIDTDTAVNSAAPTPSPAQALAGLCAGRVHLPGDPGYDRARMPWAVAVDLRPAAVVVPHDVGEVAQIVRVAAGAGLQVTTQGTGHGAGPFAGVDLHDVVLIRMHEFTGVTVDPLAQTARIVGGTQWQEVVSEAAPYGLAALHGSSPDVAVAGYCLGGGVSWYARSHGLAANALVAVELVTAAGELVRVSAEEDPDLFWAVRGGGGSFGVVVALEIALFPIADVVAGMLMWDRERAPEVVRTWAAWTREVPESVTTALRVMSFPPLPQLPVLIRGRQLVVIDGALLEDDPTAERLLVPLRALSPEVDTFRRIPAAALTAMHMDPPDPTPSVSTHVLLDELPASAVDALLAEVGPGSSTSLLQAELRHLGGALARTQPGGGALDRIAGEYGAMFLAVAATPEMAARGVTDAEAALATVLPWTSGRTMPNFTDTAGDPSRAYIDATWQRLTDIRRRVDPTGVFVANHPVPLD